MEFITHPEKLVIEARLAALIANRPVISTRIAEARALGDLKENGDYHAAREQQGMEEAEIRRLQERLASVSVIDESTSSEVVFLGSTVKMKQLDTDDVDLYRLVGEATSGASLDYTEVTSNSPMGEALMKARKGEVIRVNTPRGVKRFEILEIH